MAMAEVLVIGPEEVLTPEEVAAGIDDYLYSFTAKGKGKAKLALTALTVYPLLRFRPPFAMMSPDRRLAFIERCFINDVVERRLPGFLRKPLQSMLTATQNLAIIGYYADPRAASTVGYVPFSKRPATRRRSRACRRTRPTLDVNDPNEVDAEQINADVVIVGSGAAGSVLAYRMAERGREVVLIEGGKHVDPRDFTEDERVQFSNLFADGGLQMCTDTRFQVLQGKCVGGSTVVNNAVCLDIPPRALQRWNDPDGLDAGLEEERFLASFKTLRDWLPVYSQKNGHLQLGGSKMAEGIKKPRARRQSQRRRRQHQGLPRLRLLQHRLRLRQEAIGARQPPSPHPSRLWRAAPDVQRMLRRADQDRRAGGRPRSGASSRTGVRSGSAPTP